MKNNTKKQKIYIAGPCAAESREQIVESIQEAKEQGVTYLRISLWKPRTKPGFEGLGHEGAGLFAIAAKSGVNPASEVMVADDVKLLMDKTFSASDTAELLVWIGARNQNHFIQRDIAKVAATNPRVKLMVKNQPWHNKEHWIGIIDHVLEGGIKRENLLVCHRGFSAHNVHNPNGYRNIPDFEMSDEIKELTDLPMIFDPSHTGGSVENVFKIAKEASQHCIDGLIVEVHPNPKEALTDAKQQLTWEEFKKLKSQFENAEKVRRIKYL